MRGEHGFSQRVRSAGSTLAVHARGCLAMAHVMASRGFAHSVHHSLVRRGLSSLEPPGHQADPYAQLAYHPWPLFVSHYRHFPCP